MRDFGDAAFTEAVGTGDFIDYASIVQDGSYLDISSKSLDSLTANGTITKGEYIYMLISNIFGGDKMTRADIKTASFSDAKDGGDIATDQKFIEDETPRTDTMPTSFSTALKMRTKAVRQKCTGHW